MNGLAAECGVECGVVAGSTHDQARFRHSVNPSASWMRDYQIRSLRKESQIRLRARLLSTHLICGFRVILQCTEEYSQVRNLPVAYSSVHKRRIGEEEKAWSWTRSGLWALLHSVDAPTL